MKILNNVLTRERALVALVGTLLLVALLAPAVPDPTANVQFADARAWLGLPFAMDVSSNLPFAIFGIGGLLALRRIELAPPPLPDDALRCARLFFVGLVCTAACSSLYHLSPDVLRLGIDRAGMAVAFAGMIGLAVCERGSRRAGWPIACFALGAGLLAAAVYMRSGNVLPWAVVQFGGIALILVLAPLRPVPGAVGLSLAAVIGFYLLAKLLELGDHAVYEATNHWVAGHSLKHVVAACAAWPVLRVVRRSRDRVLRHNPRAATATAVPDGPRSPTGTFE
ncbi:hypothetical protein ACSFA3_18845 [Variovorax sp. RHLX14]|uniref:hypothetical protein n=1 Tax=Variovorax sp. RHLX14 TaxID=1259731 RepID=UPI003F47E3D5